MAGGDCEIVACFRPLQAFRTPDGSVVFREAGDIQESLNLPCGQCVGCRLERSRQWALRIMHEASHSDDNAFITLTYREVPPGGSLCYRDFQLFFKRLRRELHPINVRFFVVGEYGDESWRPHFHFGLFGFCFRDDRRQWRRASSGGAVFRSARLERLWPLGDSEIGELTRESAAYMARYVMKKVNGDLADDHYRRVDPDTGEVTYLEPEFVHMSRRPGIGADWFARYWHDVYPHDRVVMKGKVGRPPRYYDYLLKSLDPQLLEDMQQKRILEGRDKWRDSTPDRLAVREVVAKARVAAYKRKLK